MHEVGDLVMIVSEPIIWPEGDGHMEMDSDGLSWLGTLCAAGYFEILSSTHSMTKLFRMTQFSAPRWIFLNYGGEL